MSDINILRSINEKMRGNWFDQKNNAWQFTPKGDNSGILLYDDKNWNYKFIDPKSLKLEIELMATYNYTNFNNCEIHLERSKTDFVYLSRKKLDVDFLTGNF